MDSTISVIICTHNPREDYLRRTLEALRQQTLPKDRWDLLLIDNASKEPLVGQWNLSWHPQGRHILEEELGLTPARLRGIREARGDLLVFVDDDNVLDFDYLQEALRIAGRMPNLGCFGAGRLEPEYEELPDDSLRAYTGMLALRTVTEARWSNSPDDPWVPWGAGLCVTRPVAGHYLKRFDTLECGRQLGRRGKELNSCEDDEFSWSACEIGFGRGIFPELQVLHLIDRRRVQRDYLIRLAEGHAFSSTVLQHLHGQVLVEIPKPPAFMTVVAGLLALKPTKFFHEGLRWWSERKQPKLNQEFNRARDRGITRALNFLRNQAP
jgi:glycosyltransferase involved in cell wall biosynthesis